MWQTAIVALVVVSILIYLIRYYARTFRSGAPACSGCSGCCGAAAEKIAEKGLDGGGSCPEAGGPGPGSNPHSA